MINLYRILNLCVSNGALKIILLFSLCTIEINMVWCAFTVMRPSSFSALGPFQLKHTSYSMPDVLNGMRRKEVIFLSLYRYKQTFQYYVYVTATSISHHVCINHKCGVIPLYIQYVCDTSILASCAVLCVHIGNVQVSQVCLSILYEP